LVSPRAPYLSLQGGFGLRVSTCLSINLPMAGTARIPLAMEIELVELVGPVRHAFAMLSG
jgi:hypothetical protein